MRRRIFLFFILCTFSLLLAKLFFMQIVQGDFYYRKSENNRIQLIRSIAPRGRIYDCKGELLVDNRPSFCAFLIPWLAAHRIDEALEHFNAIYSIDIDGIKNIVKKQRFRPFQPIPLANNLPPALVSRILESMNEFPGIIIETVPVRHYSDYSLCSHLLGYVQEINEDELGKLKDYGYEQGDMIGKFGIEKACEFFLRGINGGTQFEVDVRGRPTNPPRILGEEEPVKGADVVLTIDKRIQTACESALRGNRGAVVVMDPFNGDVLGMASSPDFDPNIFIQPISQKGWQKIAGNPGHPMLNRTIQSAYPPGSTFKIVVAVAALEENRIDPEEVFRCDGTQKAGKRIYRCWQREGHGLVNFARGVAESCDVYFYHLGVRLGPEIIAKYARLFGLGVPSGIDISGEKSGIIPSPEWKKKVRGERWFLGDTFNYSIGQGYVLTTPLQMANIVSVIFNGGKIYKPRLVREVLFRGQGKKKFDTRTSGQVNLKPSTVETMKTALQLAVARGTGAKANIPEAEVMGKTGTAQNPGGKDHAWFVAFAQPNISKTQIVDTQARPVTVTVFVENGGGGSSVACPIAAEILRSIYRKPYYRKTIGDTQTIEKVEVF